MMAKEGRDLQIRTILTVGNPTLLDMEVITAKIKVIKTCRLKKEFYSNCIFMYSANLMKPPGRESGSRNYARWGEGDGDELFILQAPPPPKKANPENHRQKVETASRLDFLINVNASGRYFLYNKIHINFSPTLSPQMTGILTTLKFWT